MKKKNNKNSSEKIAATVLAAATVAVMAGNSISPAAVAKADEVLPGYVRSVYTMSGCLWNRQ